MKQDRTYPFFLIALFFTLTPLFPLLSFSPYLAIVYRRKTFLQALWISAACGVILDLLAVSPFGLKALQMAILTFCLYRLRIYFVDKPIGLISYTLLISLAFTILSRIGLFFYGSHLPFTWKGFVTDFFVLPLGDALYAFLFFSLSPLLYRFIRKQYFLFFQKESNKEEETI